MNKINIFKVFLAIRAANFILAYYITLSHVLFATQEPLESAVDMNKEQYSTWGGGTWFIRIRCSLLDELMKSVLKVLSFFHVTSMACLCTYIRSIRLTYLRSTIKLIL